MVTADSPEVVILVEGAEVWRGESPTKAKEWLIAKGVPEYHFLEHEPPEDFYRSTLPWCFIWQGEKYRVADASQVHACPNREFMRIS